MSDRIYRELDKNTLSKLHDTELEILHEIDRICKKNNIKYFLVAGTLLGAVRHKGFIPWDDDLDIGMFREDYDKFVDIAIKEIDDKYFVHCDKTDNNYWLPFIKIRKNNTTFDEQLTNGKKVIHNGIFVDVFPFDDCGSNRKINRVKGMIIRTISDTLLVKQKILTYKESRHPYVNRLLVFFSKKSLKSLQIYMMKSSKEHSCVICWAGAYHVNKELLSKDDALPLKNILFENIRCKCFNKHKVYLSNIYGEFMKLPPKEKRVNHGAVDISFTKGDNIISKDVVDKS